MVSGIIILGDNMNREEIQRAIAATSEEIMKLKEQIALATDRREKKRLQIMLKELQYLQLWHIEQMEHRD